MASDRFVEVYRQKFGGMFGFLSVIRDRKTGVDYLFITQKNYPGGLCVLENPKPQEENKKT